MSNPASRPDAHPTDDPELVARARGGDRAAFDELYRRHAPMAWRTAVAITASPADAADAVAEAFSRVLAVVDRGALHPEAPFVPYLLAATRNAAIDGLRQHTREVASGASVAAGVVDRREPGQVVVDRADADAARRAFESLPERWRTVLWLTEVEGMPARQAGAALGLAPNSASQLAVRARAGLREQYLQAQVSAADTPTCRRVTARLGAHAAGRLAAKEAAKVEAHLDRCADCRARAEEVDEVAGTLHRLALPLPLFLLAHTHRHWTAALTPSRGPLGLQLPGGKAVPVWAEKALAGATAAMVSVGIASAVVMGARGEGPDLVPDRPLASEQVVGGPGESALGPTPRPDPVAEAGADRPTTSGSAAPSPTTPSSPPADDGASTPTTTPPSRSAPPPEEPGGSGDPPSGPAAASDEPVLEVQVEAAGALGVSIGDQCLGLSIGETVIGCDPEVGDDVLRLQTVGQLLPDLDLAL